MRHTYRWLAPMQLSGYAAVAVMTILCFGFSVLYLHHSTHTRPEVNMHFPPSTWQPSGQTEDVDSPRPNGPPILYWQTGSTRYRAAHHISVWSSDEQEWHAVTPDLTEVSQPESAGYGVDGITSVAVTSGRWYVGTLTGDLRVRALNGQWQTIQANLPRRTVTAIATDPDATDGRVAVIGYAGYGTTTPDTPGNIFLTQNGGQTWTDASGNLPGAPVESLTYLTSNGQSRLLAVIQAHRYLMSSLGSWRDLSNH